MKRLRRDRLEGLNREILGPTRGGRSGSRDRLQSSRSLRFEYEEAAMDVRPATDSRQQAGNLWAGRMLSRRDMAPARFP